LRRSALLGVTRPNFLVLTPVCLSLGVVSAWASGHPVDWASLWVIVLGGVAAHVSVNALNEYVDFRSGLDFNTRRTPFSGGSGTLVAAPQWASVALAIGVLALLVTAACGLYLALRAGWGIVPLGLTGILVILLYSGPINRYRFLVFVAPGLGFGPLMVMGTHYALVGAYDGRAALLSLIPFFLVNNLLFLNQVPDIDADRAVGRNNFAISLSPFGRALLYGGMGVLPYLVIVVAVLGGWLPWLSLVALATLVPCGQVAVAIGRYRGVVEELVPFMGKNVVVTLATPFLLSLSYGLSLL
jgi:1,4-dihydroxy-2-naphthoate octaprenyltransferase